MHFIITLPLLVCTGCNTHEPATVIATSPSKKSQASSDQSDKKSEKSTDMASATSEVKILRCYRSQSLTANSNAIESPVTPQSEYVIVDVQISGSQLWRSNGGSFYEAPAYPAVIMLADGSSIEAEACRCEGDVSFSATKTAFIPEPPIDAERISFAFHLTGQTQDLTFQYGAYPKIQLNLAEGKDET